MRTIDRYGTELRHAARRLRARPVRGGIGVLTLALGIAASTAAFSAVKAVLLEPLPVTDQERLVVLWQRSEARSFDHVPFLPASLGPLSEMQGPLAGVAAVGTIGATPASAEGPEGPFSIQHARVAGDFFGVLGARAERGRLLDADDDRFGTAPVAVVSHDYWASRMGAREGAVGSTLRIGPVSLEIVGVAPPELDYPRGAEVWVPLSALDPDGAGPTLDRYELDVVARLAPGFELDDATGAIDRLFAENVELSTLAADLRTTGVGFADLLVGDLRPMLLATLCAGLLLLLVAVANASLLFLAGGLRSGRELAIRRALGAGRVHALAPMAADGALQVVLGVGGGIGLAALSVAVLLPLAPPDFARFASIELDVWSLAFAAGLGVLALVASTGLAGMLLVRRDPAVLLGSAFGARPEGVVLRRIVAAVQVALAVTAAVAALLLAENVRDLERLDRGFEPDGLFVVSLRTPFDFFEAPAGYRDALQEVSRTLAGRAGFGGVSPTFSAPLLERGGIDFVPRLEDQAPEDAAGNPYLGFDAVLPEYFAVAGTELRAGRLFGAMDGPDDEPVVIVNEAAAAALWPGEAALGRRVFMGGLSREEWRTVVGVVENHRFRTFPEARPALWVPLAQYDRLAPARLLVRASPAAGPIRGAVQGAFEAAWPGVRVLSVQAMSDVMQGPLRRPRFAAATLLSLALVTVLLAGLGVQGVLAVIVAERRRDLGIRIALGARATHVGRHLARHLAWIGLLGSALGAMASAWGVGLVGTLLYAGAPPVDRIVAGVCIAAALLVVVSAVVPLARAIRTDPVLALRAESSV
jgi:predicted permease